jgi:hypothetical protein
LAQGRHLKHLPAALFPVLGEKGDATFFVWLSRLKAHEFNLAGHSD